MFRASTFYFTLSIILTIYGCKKSSSPSSEPNQNDEKNKTCSLQAEDLALSLLTESSSPSLSDLTVWRIIPSSELYNTGAKQPELKTVRIQFEVSKDTNYVEWRTCSSTGWCLPSSNPNTWERSTSLDETLYNVPNSKITITARSCTDFPDTPDNRCGKTQQTVYLPSKRDDHPLDRYIREVQLTDNGLRQEGKALKVAAQEFLQNTKSHSDQLATGSKKDTAYLYFYSVATNFTRLGESDIWQYLRISSTNLRNFYQDLNDHQATTLALTETANSDADCSDNIPEDHTGEDLLASTLDPSSTSGNIDFFESNDSQSLDFLTSTTTEEEQAKNQESSSNTNQAQADTPTPATSAPATTEEDHQAQEDQNKRRVGSWLLGLGIVGAGASLATLAYFNYDLWTAKVYQFRFSRELQNLQSSTGHAPKPSEIKLLAQKYRALMPNKFDILLSTLPNEQDSSRITTTLDDFIKSSDNPKFDNKNLTSSVVEKTSHNESPNTRALKKIVALTVVSSFIAVAGGYVISEAGLTSSVSSEVRRFLTAVNDIQASIEDLLERRQKAATIIYEAGGPLL